jgi:hypothetical protein
MVVLAVFLLAAGLLAADESQRKIFATNATAEFQRTQARLQKDSNNATNQWQFARAAFALADFAADDDARAALAKQGVAACRSLILHQPNSAAGHYYLAMNLGQLARTEFLGGLKLVRDMEHEFKTAADLDAHFDYAGPERNLGLLYRDAPGWPVSIGSERKARSYSEQAVKLAPDYPENYLNLIESDLKWKQPDGAKTLLARLDAIWPKAQTNLTGEKWASSWAGWSTRRDALHKKLDAAAAPDSKTDAN